MVPHAGFTGRQMPDARLRPALVVGTPAPPLTLVRPSRRIPDARVTSRPIRSCGNWRTASYQVASTFAMSCL